MLTAGDDGVVSDHVSLAELARLRGVSKQAITKRVDRLEARGSVTTLRGARGARMISIAQFDRATEETTDAVRAANGAQAEHQVASPKLAQAQALRAGYAAETARLDLEERLGKLLPIADVEAAMTRCAEAMVRLIDQLPARADENAAAVAKDGTQGARMFLRDAARDLRARLAQEMRLLGAAKEADEAEADSA
jgi:DNA-binding MarR family transcriptional regulator